MSHIIQSSSPTKQAGKIDPRIFLLALGMFALGTDAFVIAGVLPDIAHDTHVTESVAGQLVTVFALVYAVGAPLLAAVIERWSPTRVLIISLSAFCIVNLGSALAPTFGLLIVSRVFAGCCAATFAPLAYTVGSTLAPLEKRGQALALVVGGLYLATVFGSPLGTWVGESLGWRFSFGLVVALSGVACIAMLLCGLPRMNAAPSLSLKARLRPIREPRLLLALAPTLLGYLGVYIVYTYLAPLLQQTIHVTDISGFLVSFGLGTFLGNWFAGRMTDRFGSARLLLIDLAFLAVILAVISFATFSALSSLIILFILGMANPSLFVPQQHRLLSLAPEHASVLLALNNSMLYLGIGAGAAIGGVVLRYGPATLLGWAGAICLVLAWLVLVLSIRFSRHTAEQPLVERKEEIV